MTATKTSTQLDHVKELQKTLQFAKTMRLDIQRFMKELKKQKDSMDPISFQHQWAVLFEQFTKLSKSIVAISDNARKIEKDFSSTDDDLDAAIAELGYVKLEDLSEADLVAELKTREVLFTSKKKRKTSKDKELKS